MSAERGGRRARRGARRRRRRWFGPVVVGFAAVALAVVLRSPHAGFELADDDPVSSPSRATPGSEVGVAPPLPVAETAAIPDSLVVDSLVVAEAATTTVAGPATSSPEIRAASDLESFFVALEGRDYVGAFDRYTPAMQTTVGGFAAFEAFWKAPDSIEHDDASCTADDTQFACVIRFRAYAADGTCAEATYSYRVAWTGSRHDIVAAAPMSSRRCERRVATTTTVG